MSLRRVTFLVLSMITRLIFFAPFPSKVVKENCNETGMKCLPEGTSFENNEIKEIYTHVYGKHKFVPRDQV